jgi:hypothetical protein
MMRWINSPKHGKMGAVMLSQVAALREQMSSMIEEPAVEDVEDNDEDDDD